MRTSGLPAATRKEIQSALRTYVEEVLAKEWVAMAARDEDTLEAVGHHLDHVWSAIHQCKPTNDCQHTVYSEVLSRFNDLTDTRTSRLTWTSAVILGLLCPVGLRADDWPQWRGPNRDGIVQGVKVPAQWPRTLKEVWKVEVGEGYSSPVVVGDQVYVFTRQKDNEVVLCFDVASGKEVWRSEPCPAPYKPGPAAPGDNKTRSTPTVTGGRSRPTTPQQSSRTSRATLPSTGAQVYLFALLGAALIVAGWVARRASRRGASSSVEAARPSQTSTPSVLRSQQTDLEQADGRDRDE